MKLTPLLLFLLLLVVLVIAVTTLKNPIAPVEKEGFVQFKTNVVPQTETVIPPYSGRGIVKLYDNLFIDRQNINIVEVVAPQFVGNVDNSTYVVSAGNVDLTGSSITAINVQSRDGVITYHPVTTTTVIESNPSKISYINSSYKSVPFYNSACTTTAKYQLFYIPWGTDTYIHGIQVTANPGDPNESSFKPSNVCSYYIPSDQTANMTAIYYTNNVINLTVPTTEDTSSKNNSLVTEPLYSATKQVYQLSSDVKYDIQSGNLIVNSTGSIIVYDRSGKPTTYKTTPNNTDISAKLTDGKAPWIANNTANTLQIVYMTNKKNTIVLLLKIDAAQRFTAFNIRRFNEYGVDNGTTSENSDSTTPPPGVDSSALSEYYKWYWYWNSAGPGKNSQYSNNYLLKTQIVPPVCPSCPSITCASSGSSSSNSGSSSSDSNKTKDDNIITGTVNTVGNVANKTVDTAGNIANKTLDTTSNLLTSGATGATNIVKSGVSGTVDLVKSGVSGTADLVKSGVSGTADLVKSGVSGTVGLLKDTGSGIVNTTGGAFNALTQNPNAVGGGGAYYGGMNTPYGSSGGYRAPGFSQGNGSIDSYSYYGALPSKGANYIPITADFSAFSK
jgi:hypothetical protein